jgi:hypothetical protein
LESERGPLGNRIAVEEPNQDHSLRTGNLALLGNPNHDNAAILQSGDVRPRDPPLIGFVADAYLGPDRTGEGRKWCAKEYQYRAKDKSCADRHIASPQDQKIL